jgi:hypothetical protein
MLSDNFAIYDTEFETNTYKQFALAVSALNDMGMQGLISICGRIPAVRDETIDIAGRSGQLQSYNVDKSEIEGFYTSTRPNGQCAHRL